MEEIERCDACGIGGEKLTPYIHAETKNKAKICSCCAKTSRINNYYLDEEIEEKG